MLPQELILTETEQINIQQGQASYMQTLKRQAKVDSGKRMSTNFVIRRDPTGQCIFRPIPFKGMRKVRKHVDDDEGWSGGSKKVKVRRLTSSSGDGDSLSYPFENETTIRNREKDRLMLEIFGPESTDDSDESGTEEEFMETNLMSLVSLQWGKRGKRSMRKGTWKRHILENHVGQHKNTQDEMGIQVLLVSMDASVIPNLQNPQVSCKPNVTLKSLCEMYVAPYVEAQAEKIEMYVVKELVAELTMIDPHRDRVEIVNKEDSVGGLRMYNFNNGYVIIGYMKTP
ncbi:unnamed protein product [Arabidopsis thaliana]|uniref:Uncharacterized protein n=1 Tax=Arabidopsis thaliana TaxID=3702 RepID=A0A654EDP2_ARATH|nr:unnamed protein product [Arabidopsis thaliana]